MSQQHHPKISRRDLIQTGLAIGIGAAMPIASRATERSLPLITKAIPSTGEKIPVIGLGTNAFSNADYNNVLGVLQRTYALGGTVIDTAAEYGEGEVIVGKALAELGLTSKMFIATKFSNAEDAAKQRGSRPPDPTNGMDSALRSLQRLQKIDLLFAHHIGSVDSLMPIMLDLKKQGRIRYIGFTSADPFELEQSRAHVLEYLRKYPIDFVQISYSLADRWAEAELLPLAQHRKVAVMTAMPLGGHGHSLITKANGRELPTWAADFGVASWSQLFLKYVVSHPAVTCAIPGATKPEHVEDNQAAGRGRLFDAATRKKIEEFWNAKT